jgi:hypothetical protein
LARGDETIGDEALPLEIEKNAKFLGVRPNMRRYDFLFAAVAGDALGDAFGEAFGED